MSIENSFGSRRRQHSLAPSRGFVALATSALSFSRPPDPNSEADWLIQRRREVDNLLRGRPPYGKGFCLICFHTKAYWGQRIENYWGLKRMIPNTTLTSKCCQPFTFPHGRSPHYTFVYTFTRRVLCQISTATKLTLTQYQLGSHPRG